jgi:hypothetical protein
MGEPKRNPVLGEIFARARQKPKRNLMWEWLKGIHIPRRVWGGLLLLFGSVLAGWLIHIGYTQNWDSPGIPVKTEYRLKVSLIFPIV